MSFRGNQYTIARGDINFANPFRLDPVLNVEATTTIRQYEVTLDFTGPASRLTLAYRSDPPLPSSDIIELLALGQTGEESAARTATGQNAGVGASALLSEAISSQLGGRCQRHDRAASYTRPCDHLHYGRHDDAVSSDSNRIHD
jgi:translocation and assembly module TamB